MISIFDIFSLLCGLAIFLYGMQQGEKNLKIVGGSDLRKLISIVTSNRICAYFAGLATTLITQSSSATTVMLVGLVSSGLMNLGQSLGMILGSDLATTFTVQLFAFKFYQIAPFLIAAGFFATFSRNEKLGNYGNLLLNLGFIFFGMHMMSVAVTPLRSNPVFEQMIRASFTSPWYGLLAGTLITAIIQSSAATLTIVIALAQSIESGNGLNLGISNFFPLVLGANLGTCATAFLSTLRADIDGVRVAWAHFLFKFSGTTLIFPVCWFLSPFDNLIQNTPAIQIAIIHTVFNIFISIIFLPFLKPFEKALFHFIKPGKKVQQRYHISYLHDNVLTLPHLALSQATKEIDRMSERVSRMLDQSYQLLTHYNHTHKLEITDLDDEVDFLHEQIVTFLTKISRKELNPLQASKTYLLIMVTTDLEHIGDIISKNILSIAEKIGNDIQPLSPEGKKELLEFFDTTIEYFKETMAAFTIDDTELARTVFNQKASTKKKFTALFDQHMNRLYNHNQQSLLITSIHIDFLEELQRINHFTFRIALHLLKHSSQGTEEKVIGA